jgi:hypothetical protein
MQSYLTRQNNISYIPLSVQKFGKLCGTSKALQHFPVTHLSHQYAFCSHLSDNKHALVMHFATPMFPLLPGGVNPISLPGYPSSSDLCTLHTISIFYFLQYFGLQSVPYFFILQSINSHPKLSSTQPIFPNITLPFMTPRSKTTVSAWSSLQAHRRQLSAMGCVMNELWVWTPGLRISCDVHRVRPVWGPTYRCCGVVSHSTPEFKATGA